MYDLNNILYLGIDYMYLNTYAIYLDVIGMGHEKLMFGLWQFPFDRKKKGTSGRVAERFDFDDRIVSYGLEELCGLKRVEETIAGVQALLNCVNRENELGKPVLWVTDSMILPYHWTYQNKEQNHSHMTLILHKQEDYLRVVDPGWIEKPYDLDIKELKRENKNKIVVLQEGEVKDFDDYFSIVISYLLESANKIDGNGENMLQRIQAFSGVVKQEFVADKEVVLIEQDRSKIWRNPLIRNLNEISKYRFRISEAFLAVFSEEQPVAAKQLSEMFLTASKSWNTVKFMCSHLLLQGKADSESINKILEVINSAHNQEAKIMEYLTCL